MSRSGRQNECLKGVHTKSQPGHDFLVELSIPARPQRHPERPATIIEVSSTPISRSTPS